MVDIQSPTAEIRRGKKEEERRKIETTGQNILLLFYGVLSEMNFIMMMMNLRICYAGRP